MVIFTTGTLNGNFHKCKREKKCNSFAKPVRNPLLKHSTSDSTHVKLARDVNAGKKVQKLLNCWTDKLTDSLSIVLSLFSSSSQRFPRLKWSLNHLPPSPRKLLSRSLPDFVVRGGISFSAWEARKEEGGPLCACARGGLRAF